MGQLSTVLCVQPDLSKLKLEADSMWRQFISAMVPEITNLVKFCKKLPGRFSVEICKAWCFAFWPVCLLGCASVFLGPVALHSGLFVKWGGGCVPTLAGQVIVSGQLSVDCLGLVGNCSHDN